MKQEEIKKLIEELGYEEVLLFESPSYDNAFIRLTEDGRAVYDYYDMVQCLVESDGMTEEEAEDFIQYNTIRALPYYENHPVIMRKLEYLL